MDVTQSLALDPTGILQGGTELRGGCEGCVLLCCLLLISSLSIELKG